MDASTEDLIAGLKSWLPWWRVAAARELAARTHRGLRNWGVTEGLLRALKDRSASVRVPAVEALAAIGEPALLIPLLRALGDFDRWVRAAALRGLTSSAETRQVMPLVRALLGDDAAQREEAVRALQHAKRWGVARPMICQLVEPLDDAGRRAAAAALEETFARRLADLQSPLLFARAAATLGDLQDPRAVDPLIGIARTDGLRCWAALRALAEFDDDRVVGPLIEGLHAWDSLAMIVHALGRLGRPAVLPLIRVSSGAAGSLVAGRASQALHGMAQDELAAGVLDALLAGDARTVARIHLWAGEASNARRRILTGWVQMGTAGRERLLRLLEHPERWVNAWAAAALSEPAEVLWPMLEQGYGRRLGAAVGLAHLQEACAIAPLMEVLQDNEWEVRRVAAEALGNMGALAAPALVSLRRMQRSEPAPTVRDACADAVKRIEKALAAEPAELEAASAPAGTGTELQAALAQAGRGSELEAGEADQGRQ